METQVPAELKLLGLAVIIGLVHLFWGAAAARGQQDLKWAAGSRDEPMPPLVGVAARLDRGYRNFMETFPLFAAAILAVVLMERTGPLSLWGSGLYVAARALYVPIYASGVRLVRSLVWFVAVAGLVMVIVALFK
jgi:uncharacterized MAPEG superfamily protein